MRPSRLGELRGPEGIADVDGDRFDQPAELLAELARAVQPGPVDVGAEHVGAETRQVQRELSPDPVPGPRDEHPLGSQTKRCAHAARTASGSWSARAISW